VGHRASLDGRKISSPPGFDPGPSSPYSVAIPTELPGPQCYRYTHKICDTSCFSMAKMVRRIRLSAMFIRTLPV